MEWTFRDMRLLRQAVLTYANDARSAANFFAQKGPQSSLEKFKSAQEDARTLEEIYEKLVAQSIKNEKSRG